MFLKNNIIKELVNKIYNSLRQTGYFVGKIIPLVMGMFLLMSMFRVVVPEEFYGCFFTGNNLVDALIGASVGSASAGHPVTSYIVGGEFIKQGVGLVAIIAFLLSWVTVGIIQLPVEGEFLGWRFALIRNGVNFVLSVIGAWLIVAFL